MRYKIIFLLLLISGASQAAEQLYTNQPTVTPELALSGKYSVGVSTISTSNPDQLSASDFVSRYDRELTLEVWYPSQKSKETVLASYKNLTRSHQSFNLQGTAYRDAPPLEKKGTFPLIVLSHGYTGYRTIMFYIAEHLASHGYVVVGIDHTDSTNQDVDFSKSPGSGFISTLLNRARDQQFVLDYFTDTKNSLTKHVNVSAATIIGYSMGGYGALNTVGGCYQFSKEGLAAMGIPAELAGPLTSIFNSCNAGREAVDPRWKAMIAIAPWGGEQGVHTTNSLNNIKVPSLFIAGSEDDISGFENGVKDLFSKTGAEPTFMLTYENARHNIAAHPAPKIAYQNDLDIGHYFEPSWKMETMNRINKHMSLAFLNCHIKNQETACEYLPTSENVAQAKQTDGSMSQAWPGFKERWGTGLRFYRK